MFTEYLLFAACLFILLGSVIITFKTRFVQLRFLPTLFRMLKNSLLCRSEEREPGTIAPHKALMTAMSTTLGISTMVAPIIAIHLGGPGALIGFLLTSFFGSAATFTEVNLSMTFRKKLRNGHIMGGPMPYLASLFSPLMAKWYALCCLLLMMAWSAAQANQLTAILNSPLLGIYRLTPWLSSGLIALFVLVAIAGGIKRIGTLSAKLVPVMFLLYVGSCLGILLFHIQEWGSLLALIGRSALSPYAMASGGLVGGLVTALRWGVFKGTQACEAGIGTQAIPHSMSDANDPAAQGALAMCATYTAGFVAFLSGCVALATKTWENPEIPLGISMVAASFKLYFSTFGILVVALSAFLFGIGTILGNSFNGSQCFLYLTGDRKMGLYLAATALVTFLGGLGEVKAIWSMSDLILAGIAVPHMGILLIHTLREPAALPS